MYVPGAPPFFARAGDEAMVLVDLSKAFDSVNHDLLLCKMDRYVIQGKEQRWFHSYLSGRKRVVIDGELSSWRTM